MMAIEFYPLGVTAVSSGYGAYGFWWQTKGGMLGS